MGQGGWWPPFGERVRHALRGDGVVMGPEPDEGPRAVMVRWDSAEWTTAYVGELESRAEFGDLTPQNDCLCSPWGAMRACPIHGGK